MGYFDVPEIEYDRYTNRQLVVVPLTVLAIALAVLTGSYLVTGAPVDAGIEFTGGSELIIDTTAEEEAIPDAFEQEVSSVQSVQEPADRYIVQFTSTDETALSQQAEANLEPVDEGDGVVQFASSTSPSFAEQTQQMALYGIVIAFVGMSVLAFLLFRTFIPSIAIVLSAFSDMIIPLAFMSLAGISLSLGTVAALLMLIGYSVDSDILLNNHILRRGGGFYESTYRAMRTGVTMTLTAMAAMLVMAITAWLFGIQLLASIGLILFVGLSADLMNTYMLNLSLLRWYKFDRVNR